MDRIAEYVGEMWKEITGTNFDPSERSMNDPSALWSKARIIEKWECQSLLSLMIGLEKESFKIYIKQSCFY